jgi:predicted RNase H-like HicB family nuclease
MTSPAASLAAIHVVRPLRTRGPFPAFAPGDVVYFQVPAGDVTGSVIGVDAKARADLPLGLPYRIVVREAPAGCGYAPGSECTVRAGCLEREGVAPGASVVLPPPPRPIAAPPALPMFLVAYIREGGNAPVQGAMLVQGASLEAASAAATQALQAELEADIRDHGELPEAMVMLLNAAEVPALDAASRNASTPVLATVFW